MKKIKYAILGAGSAGLTARSEIAKHTDDYLVFDAGTLGTTCARVGCMPSKVLIQAASDFDRRKKMAEQGILGAESLTVDRKQTMAHVRKLRDRFVRGVSLGMEKWQAEKLVREYARFTSPTTLVAGEVEYEFEKAIVAVGTTPMMLTAFKGHEEYTLNSDSIFEQVDLPDSIAVIGLGVIGIELGQSLARLGIDVVGIHRRRNISGIENPEINEYACRHFEGQMKLDFSGLTSVAFKDNKLLLKTGKGEYQVDKALLCTGRISNLPRTDLHKLSQSFSEFGKPKLVKGSFALEDQPHIFVVGDATQEKAILHEAADEGRIAAFNALSQKNHYFTPRAALGVTFSEPNIARAGQSFEELRAAGVDYETGVVTFEGQGRSIVKLKEVGLLHLYGEKGSGKILGAEMIGPDAEHLAHLISWVVQSGLNVNEMLALPYYHPVLEEGLRTAVRDLRNKLKIQTFDLEMGNGELRD